MKKVLSRILIGIIVTVILYFCALWYFFYCLQCQSNGSLLSDEEIIENSDSPDHEHSLVMYRINGGATVSFALRGELQTKNIPNGNKVIYLGYKEADADIHWLDNQTVVINGKQLNIFTDTYDWRNEKVDALLD